MMCFSTIAAVKALQQQAAKERPLERDPERRYPTPGALAEDLGRFLAGERTRLFESTFENLPKSEIYPPAPSAAKKVLVVSARRHRRSFSIQPEGQSGKNKIHDKGGNR